MKNVLIIDDDPFVTDLLAELLKTEGIKCTTANSIESVLKDWAGLANYSVILLDIMMMRDGLQDETDPKLESGEILFKKIRQSFPKKHVVIISAKDIGSMAIDFKHEPNVDIIQKPLDEKDFFDLLKVIKNI